MAFTDRSRESVELLEGSVAAPDVGTEDVTVAPVIELVVELADPLEELF